MVWLNKGLHACEASLWVPADVVFVARCFIATLYLPWVPEVFSRVHREASFRRVAGQHVFGRRPKTRATKLAAGHLKT